MGGSDGTNCLGSVSAYGALALSFFKFVHAFKCLLSRDVVHFVEPRGQHFAFEYRLRNFNGVTSSSVPLAQRGAPQLAPLAHRLSYAVTLHMYDWFDPSLMILTPGHTFITWDHVALTLPSAFLG